jgi:hypothetical protein
VEKRNSHGHTPAGWYSALTIFIGFIVGGFGVGAYNLVLSLIGAAIVLFGVVLAVILQKAGYGQFAPRASRSVTSARDYLGEKRADDEAPAEPTPTH